MSPYPVFGAYSFSTLVTRLKTAEMRSWIPLFLEISRTRASNLVTSANPSMIGRFIAKLSDQAHDCRRKYREWRSYVTITMVVAIVSCLGLLFTIAKPTSCFPDQGLGTVDCKEGLSRVVCKRRSKLVWACCVVGLFLHQ